MNSPMIHTLVARQARTGTPRYAAAPAPVAALRNPGVVYLADRRRPEPPDAA